MIVSSLDGDKGQDILAFDLTGKSSVADHMIVASGTSARQVGAMAGHIVTKLRAIGRKVRSEGQPACDWVLIDVGDIVVHIFRPEVRAFYNIESIWTAAKSGKPAPKHA
ncbi:MAG: ribosome silencing factor [Rhodospirillaceae bacterium]|nr:ribosome silencing factor [Rhodospirillaceae bacterium]